VEEKLWSTSVFFKKQPKAKNRPTVGKSPNLVALIEG
jgi:hypothetical protein